MAVAGGREPAAQPPRVPAQDGSPAVLVLRALGLGDLLTGVPALRGLRRRFPRHRIVLAAPLALADLALATGAVDALVPTRGPVPPPWRGRPPELAVNLHGRGPQSIAALKARSPGRLWSHACGAHPDVAGPSWPAEVHETDRWCALLHYYGVAADPTDLRLTPPDAVGRPGAVVVHPGAAHEARRWPVLRFAEVAKHLAARGEAVVVTGSAAERPLAERIARVARLPGRAVLAGGTNVARLAALVAGASLVICGDTGVAHLATAFGTPSVVLFGPVSPRLWGPRIDHELHASLWAGRIGSPFGDRLDSGLAQIGTDQVIAAAERLLDARAAARRPPETTSVEGAGHVRG
ncbi:glycosyltransferase family 9 protein [Allonocardiopsis opalescens]|uniref:ADP-heptose:LPS heptosyltransferase n=1 Tax=Allonocardiopsis opalescens TaxID=1144618 RepID=A0A2T0PXC3_9ACTN|nr:glycosyltransferase family 9 protein [Allonocardiopsis opalescens]PRX96179.1 ADP-heptose:LPS heptosyltransferase [Allonocardiopsis opalescens]